MTDFVFFLRGRVGSVSFAVDDAQWKALLPLKAVWLWIRVLVPLYCFHPLHALALILLPLAIGAHYLENIFIVNHIQVPGSPHTALPPPAAVVPHLIPRAAAVPLRALWCSTGWCRPVTRTGR